jgi:hypothetical protein
MGRLGGCNNLAVSVLAGTGIKNPQPNGPGIFVEWRPLICMDGSGAGYFNRRIESIYEAACMW